MKDYHDLVLLSRNPALIPHNDLKTAIASTFQNRGTIFELINFGENELKPLQKLWTAHLQDLGNKSKDLGLTKHIQEATQEINSYLVMFGLSGK